MDIRHQKVIDLLYDNRKNEEYRFKSFRHSLLVVLLSIAAMVAGVILLGRMLQTQTNEAFLYLGGACLLILVGVYELHRQIPLLLHRFAKQNLRHKYKEENLFFLGQIGRRIHSAGRTMAVVAILLTITACAMQAFGLRYRSKRPVFPNGIRTKINYKFSIALYLVSVKM